jgi:phage tail tape-measure protein
MFSKPIITKSTITTLGLTAVLAVAAALPAAAATHHMHRAPLAGEQSAAVTLLGTAAVPGAVSTANPITAGSNCGESDCRSHYNRLTDY